jgi:tetratricopeptide (TPR) repeat protein
MPKQLSSNEQSLAVALDLARKQRCEEAQRIAHNFAVHELTPPELRMAAQVYNRCGSLDRAEICWLELERRDGMEPGDYYMLGSLQTRMSKLESAAKCFEREIAMASTMGSDYFLGSSAIRLADLMLRLNNLSRAVEILDSLNDKVGDYIEGVGFRSKTTLLGELKEKLNQK